MTCRTLELDILRNYIGYSSCISTSSSPQTHNLKRPRAFSWQDPTQPMYLIQVLPAIILGWFFHSCLETKISFELCVFLSLFTMFYFPLLPLKFFQIAYNMVANSVSSYPCLSNLMSTPSPSLDISNSSWKRKYDALEAHCAISTELGSKAQR